MRLSLALLVLLLFGCIEGVNGYGAAAPQVRVQAAKDLDCPDNEIRLEEELGGRFKAIGCGRKAYYRSACEALRCTVQGEEGGQIPWRDRPDPNPNDPTPLRTYDRP